ncbi:MAG: TetR/AcrR family transcriptional regulator [Pedobacter sp.]|nr:MAG: TetR/AcrR family transcriptional regulator [Pedobacter sp.]
MELKTHIIQEADKLFELYGFKSVTMDDIAKHLGISKKTIYQNFNDKNELVKLLIKDRLANLKCINAERSEKAQNAVEEIYLSIQEIKKSVKNLNHKLFFELQKYHPQAWQLLNEYKQKSIYADIVSNLNRGLAEGLYRPELNVEVIAQVRMNQINMIFNRSEQILESNLNLSQVLQEISLHFLYGVCNEKGHKLIQQLNAQIEEQ